MKVFVVEGGGVGGVFKYFEGAEAFIKKEISKDNKEIAECREEEIKQYGEIDEGWEDYYSPWEKIDSNHWRHSHDYYRIEEWEVK